MLVGQHRDAGSSAVVSLQLLSCVHVIVPDRFRAREGLTSDDVQAGRPVTRNEVLRAMYCEPGWQGSRWPGSTTG
jgi:hypothetical protein